MNPGITENSQKSLGFLIAPVHPCHLSSSGPCSPAHPGSWLFSRQAPGQARLSPDPPGSLSHSPLQSTEDLGSVVLPPATCGSSHPVCGLENLVRPHLQISPNLFPGGSSSKAPAASVPPGEHAQPHCQVSPTLILWKGPSFTLGLWIIWSSGSDCEIATTACRSCLPGSSCQSSTRADSCLLSTLWMLLSNPDLDLLGKDRNCSRTSKSRNCSFIHFSGLSH